MQHKPSESRRGKTDVFGLILCAVVVAAVIFVWVSWKGSNRGTIAILRMEDVARQIGFDVEDPPGFSSADKGMETQAPEPEPIQSI